MPSSLPRPQLQVQTEVAVTLRHAPVLGRGYRRIAFLPPVDAEAADLLEGCAGALGATRELEVLDLARVAALLGGTRAPVLSGAGAVEVGRKLNADVLLAADLDALETTRMPLQKRMAWRDEAGAVHTRTTHSARTQVRLHVSFQAADCLSGRVFPPYRVAVAPSMENHAVDGEPFFPSVAEVLEWAHTQVQRHLLRLFLPWEESRSLIFFDDPDFGMQEACRLLEAADQAGALLAALETLERVRQNAEALPRHVARAHYNAGLCLFLRGDHDAAMPLLQKAYAVEPMNRIFREAAEECQSALHMRRRMG